MRRINLYVTGPAVETWLARQKNANAAINEVLEAFVSGKPTEREIALEASNATLKELLRGFMGREGTDQAKPDVVPVDLGAIDLSNV